MLLLEVTHAKLLRRYDLKLGKTTVFSAIITFIRIGSGFVAGKFIAMFTGPSGVAFIGAFTNFISIILSFANGAITTGVVKYTAEFSEDKKSLSKVFSTSLRISVCSSAMVGLILIIFGATFSNLIFSNPIYANPVRVLGGTVILYSLNSLLISILNGIGQIKSYTIVNTIGSLIGLIFTVLLVFYFKITGALYALVLSQSIVFFVTLTIVWKSSWFTKSSFLKPFDRKIALKLGQFSVMAIVTALTVPVAQLILRNMVMDKLGVESAGYWQGLMRVSDGYLMLLTTALGTYYLPKLSMLKTNFELRKEIYNGYKIILPVVLSGCIIIYYLRFFIIKILYTPEFTQMESLFFWQLVGDFFKMASWISAYLMLAKAMTRLYILTEIIFSTSYVLLASLFLNIYGLEGMVIAFGVNYIICFFFMLFSFRKLLFYNEF